MDDKAFPGDREESLTDTCTWANCDRPIKLKRAGLCSMHASRQRDGRDMDAPPRAWTCGQSAPWPQRFWDKVDRRTDGECWPWLAYINDGGYGNIMIDGRPHRAHRVAYELLRGKIPEGLVTDHLCRNRWCVNPWHLEAVTNEENIRRGTFFDARPATRVECPNGHEYTEENTRIAKDGTRRCRICERRDSLAGYYRRRKGANRLNRADCAHCGRDVAIHPKSGQFAHHMTDQDGCLFGCCRLSDTCQGTLRTANEAAQRIDDRSALREWRTGA